MFLDTLSRFQRVRHGDVEFDDLSTPFNPYNLEELTRSNRKEHLYFRIRTMNGPRETSGFVFGLIRRNDDQTAVSDALRNLNEKMVNACGNKISFYRTLVDKTVPTVEWGQGDGMPFSMEAEEAETRSQEKSKNQESKTGPERGHTVSRVEKKRFHPPASTTNLGEGNESSSDDDVIERRRKEPGGMMGKAMRKKRKRLTLSQQTESSSESEDSDERQRERRRDKREKRRREALELRKARTPTPPPPPPRTPTPPPPPPRTPTPPPPPPPPRTPTPPPPPPPPPPRTPKLPPESNNVENARAEEVSGKQRGDQVNKDDDEYEYLTEKDGYAFNFKSGRKKELAR